MVEKTTKEHLAKQILSSLNLVAGSYSVRRLTNKFNKTQLEFIIREIQNVIKFKM